MFLVWTSQQTAIISLYSFYNRHGVCLLRGTDCIYKFNSDVMYVCPYVYVVLYLSS